jgi:uncharacterized protein
MSDASMKQPAGSIAWTDLTIENATDVRDFYRDVVGWESQGLDMGGYEDFVMSVPATGVGVAGICHARGLNAAIPPQWLIYVIVENLAASIEKVSALGGQVISAPRFYGSMGRYAVIRDPAGAVLALFETTD